MPYRMNNSNNNGKKMIIQNESISLDVGWLLYYQCCTIADYIFATGWLGDESKRHSFISTDGVDKKKFRFKAEEQHVFVVDDTNIDVMLAQTVVRKILMRD